MANLTLVIDDDVLRRARIKALEEGTSVNAVARASLERYADEDQELRGLRDFVESAKKYPGGSTGGRIWRRDELYDRRGSHHSAE